MGKIEFSETHHNTSLLHLMAARNVAKRWNVRRGSCIATSNEKLDAS